MADKVNEFICPACGSSLKFDASSQIVKCPYCDSEFDVNELNNFAADNNQEFKEDTSWDTKDSMNEFSTSEQEGMTSYLCDACGGEVICGPNTSSTSCPYCGNNVLIKSRLTGALKPKYIIPFKKTNDDAKNALIAYYKGKVLLPKVFKQLNKINEIKPLYVPYWLYDADVDARIKYDAQIIRRWSDSRYDYEEIKYFSIIREGNIGYEHLPVDASKSIDNKLTEAIEPYDFSEAKEFIPAYLAGYMSDKYDVTAEENTPRATQRIKEGTEIAFRKSVSNQYDRISINSSNIRLFNTKAEYALYPLYILSTKYKDKTYTFAMNGETGKVRGDLPMSIGKFLAFLFGIMGGCILLGIIIAACMGFSSDGLTILGCLSIAGIIAGFATSFGLKSKLKGAKLQIGSLTYYKKDSLKMRVAKDYFLYSRVHKREKPRPQDNNRR